MSKIARMDSMAIMIPENRPIAMSLEAAAADTKLPPSNIDSNDLSALMSFQHYQHHQNHQ